MFVALGRFTFRRRRSVLLAGVVFVIAAGIWGSSVLAHLVPGGYEDPASESYRAARVAQQLGQHPADVVVLYSSAARTVDDPEFRAAVTASLAGVSSGLVASEQGFYSTNAAAFVSRDRHKTFVVLSLSGGSDKVRQRQFDVLRATLTAPGLTVQYGGAVPVNQDVSHQVSQDLRRAELISLPLLLVLLVVIFRSLVAAALPLAVGGVGIVGAFAVLRLITLGPDVSVFALNIVTMLGLGIAVDYALFMVSRFREELHQRDGDVQGAVVATVATSGRTVAFSGLTVAASLSSLMLFPQVFLKSIGYGGVAAVVVDMLAALTVLPALLAVLGRRVDALRLPTPWRRAAEHGPAAHGGWYALARSVMRRPIPYVVVLVAVLLGAAFPFLGARFGGFTPSVLPASSPGRVASESLTRDFTGNATAPIQVAVTGVREGRQLGAYADRLAAVDGVTGATVTTVRRDAALVLLGYDGDPQSRHAQDVVRRVRAVPVPAGLRRLVGGRTALSVDLLASVARLLPYMVGMIAVVMFVLLFLAFGSFVLPIKALVMNVLSLGASFGVITWIFQDGHLSGLLRFTPTDFLEATDPILLLAIVFGLSMDYELFLLSRIREQWDVAGDNTDAVATGLQRSGRIITSAALLLVVVIAAFSTSQIVILKMIGVGMMVAILVDATVVRALLVPATMRLLGHYNWWAPAPLARWWNSRHRRPHAEAPVAPPRVRVGAGGHTG